MNDKKFLSWIYDRLIFVYGERSQFDYMLRFKAIINNTQNVTTKPCGGLNDDSIE